MELWQSGLHLSTIAKQHKQWFTWLLHDVDLISAVFWPARRPPIRNTIGFFLRLGNLGTSVFLYCIDSYGKTTKCKVSFYDLESIFFVLHIVGLGFLWESLSYQILRYSSRVLRQDIRETAKSDDLGIGLGTQGASPAGGLAERLGGFILDECEERILFSVDDWQLACFSRSILYVQLPGRTPSVTGMTRRLCLRNE